VGTGGNPLDPRELDPTPEQIVALTNALADDPGSVPNILACEATDRA
jgi:hypothetical protein